MFNYLTFWQRIRTKRRVSILDDHTLNELWSFRLSKLGLIITITMLFVVALVVLSLAIIFTPMRNILPGYNQNIRHQLMEQSVRLDSLSNSVNLQRQYLSVIRDITAGEVSTDTVQSLDSMQLVFQDQLLKAKMEATEEFVDQYEEKEKDYLQLFDVQEIVPEVTIFRPSNGVLVKQFAPQEGQYGIMIQTKDKERVVAVLAGSVVFVNYELNNTYTIVMQHKNYVSVYRNLSMVNKEQGAILQAGETLGTLSAKLPLTFELWKEGDAINPENVIAF